MDIFIEQIEQYQKLSSESRDAFLKICVQWNIKKGAVLPLADEPVK